jgi:hypothetical protein
MLCLTFMAFFMISSIFFGDGVFGPRKLADNTFPSDPESPPETVLS